MKPFKETLRRTIEESRLAADESERSHAEASRELEHAQLGFFWIVASLIALPLLLADSFPACGQDVLVAVLAALIAGFFLALPMGILAKLVPWPFAWMHRLARRIFPSLP